MAQTGDRCRWRKPRKILTKISDFEIVKSVRICKRIERLIPEISMKIVSKEFEAANSKINSMFDKTKQNEFEILETKSSIKGFTTQNTVHDQWNRRSRCRIFSCCCKTTGCQLVGRQAWNKGLFSSCLYNATNVTD